MGKRQAAQLYGRGAAASLTGKAYGGIEWMIKDGAEIRRVQSNSLIELVRTVRLADWALAQRPAIGNMELLKIDVEGMEWEVLQGTEPLLSSKRIGAIVLEYSHFWSFSNDSSARSL